MDKIDMGDFIQHLRPSPLDKVMGISPERRAAMNAEREEREAREDAIATDALKGMTEEQVDCICAYFNRHM
jgi:hypothetical protein